MAAGDPVEEKLIEKIRKVLIADSVIDNYFNTRVYASHISSIEEVVYPAISLHLLRSDPHFSNPEIFFISIQIDVWIQKDNYNMKDVLDVCKAIRNNLHRQRLIDTTISLSIGQSVQESAGPLIYEEETSLYHFPLIYSFGGVA